MNPAAAPKADDDEDIDLFGSDDEEDDAEKAALTAKRLEEYKAKKALKPKTSMSPKTTQLIKGMLTSCSRQVRCHFGG